MILCIFSYNAAKTDGLLGYNDFNNLVMQTIWWLPNKILRHIHKKRFSIFLSCFVRICKQSLQKVLIRAKIFIQKFNTDFESVEKFWKNAPKKVISKSATEICTIFTFTHLLQTCFAYNFFCAFFKNFFNGFEISVKFCVFWYLFWFIPKIYYYSMTRAAYLSPVSFLPGAILPPVSFTLSL